MSLQGSQDRKPRPIRGYLAQDLHTSWRKVLAKYSRTGQSGKDKRIDQRIERARNKAEVQAEVAANKHETNRL